MESKANRRGTSSKWKSFVTGRICAGLSLKDSSSTFAIDRTK